MRSFDVAIRLRLLPLNSMPASSAVPETHLKIGLKVLTSLSSVCCCAQMLSLVFIAGKSSENARLCNHLASHLDCQQNFCALDLYAHLKRWSCHTSRQPLAKYSCQHYHDFKTIQRYAVLLPFTSHGCIEEAHFQSYKPAHHFPHQMQPTECGITNNMLERECRRTKHKQQHVEQALGQAANFMS